MTSDLNTAGHGIAEPELLKEPHWDDSERSPSDVCVAEFAATHGLRSIAHFSNRFLDFVVRPHGVGRQSPDYGDDEISEAEGRTGGELVQCFEDFDLALRPTKTGELMRMVVAAPEGCGLYCGRIKLGLHLVGITRESGGADHLDFTMNRIITQIRDEFYRLPDEHLGGDRRLSMRPVPSDDGDAFSFDLAREELKGTAMEVRLNSLWAGFVNYVDLQYAALYRDWSLVCVGDAFDHRKLGPQFRNIEPGARRALYRDVAQRLRTDIARLRDIMLPVTTAPIDRLVLDVQEGAVYIHWLGRRTGDFIVGVTMNQELVHVAEQRLRMLAGELPAEGET